MKSYHNKPAPTSFLIGGASPYDGGQSWRGNAACEYARTVLTLTNARVTFLGNMRTTTVRELRHHFTNVLQWVQEGERVQITKRGKPVAVISPPLPPKPRKIKWPDFAARAKEIFGDKIISDKQWQELRDYDQRRL